jgi:hypothetical protein
MSAVATTVGLIGVLHMPFARGLLMRVGGCPVGHASLAELDSARHAVTRAERGVVAAPARPALGFELDKTTVADMRAWAERSHVTCDDVREGLFLCKNVAASALGSPDADGPATELHLGFDTRGHLVDVSTMRMHASATPARDIEARLEAQVGMPQEKSGSFDGEHLAKPGAAGLSSVSYRYSDYMAEVIAMRFQADGLVVREHYMSAND